MSAVGLLQLDWFRPSIRCSHSFIGHISSGTSWNLLYRGIGGMCRIAERGRKPQLRLQESLGSLAAQLLLQLPLTCLHMMAKLAFKLCLICCLHWSRNRDTTFNSALVSTQHPAPSTSIHTKSLHVPSPPLLASSFNNCGRAPLLPLFPRHESVTTSSHPW